MTQYNTLNIKQSNSQVNKLKSGIKSGTEVTLKLSENDIGDSNDETNFSHKFLSTNTQVARLCKVIANGLSANIKLSKTHLDKIVQSEGFLGRRLGQLLKNGMLMKNILKSLAKSVLMTLELAAALATDGVIPKKTFESGMRTFIISNDVMKIVKSLVETGLLIKGISEIIKDAVKNQKGGFLKMLLGTLGASLLENLLTDKGTIRPAESMNCFGQVFK